MTSGEIETLTRRLIPRPRSIDFTDGAEYLLKDECPITIEVSAKTGIRQKVLALCKQYWNIKPVLTLNERKKKSGGLISQHTDHLRRYCRGPFSLPLPSGTCRLLWCRG